MKAILSRVRDESGFTVLEFLVILVLLTLIYGLVAGNVDQQIARGRAAAAKVQIKSFKNMLQQYKLDNGTYPTTEQGLDALLNKPDTPPIPANWNGPYIDEDGKVPMDPWGKPYVYLSPGTKRPNSYDLFSLGGDGQEGGSGSAADITNWDNEGE
jgi:general secretion pathway protein G